MKKIHAIVVVLLMLLLGVFLADWVVTKFQTAQTLDSMSVEQEDLEYTAKYANDAYGFSFEYDPVLFVVDTIGNSEPHIFLHVSVSPRAESLSGLQGLLDVQVSKKPFQSKNPVKEFIGTVEVLKHTYSIAGGDFVLFEKKNMDGTYITIGLPKKYLDMAFDIDDDLDTMMGLSIGLQDIINSFEFDETNIRK